jgi:hypothetical protein
MYTNVVKFPAVTTEHIKKLCLHSLSSAKWHPHIAFFTGQTGVSWMGKNSQSQFL